MFRRHRLHVVGNINLIPLNAESRLAVHVRLHCHEIDDPREQVSFADRQLDRHSVGAEPVLHHLDDIHEIRADAVHLVDERNARNTVFIHLTPDRFRLRLHAADRTEERDGTIKDAERPLDFDGKVHVARRIDDIDPMVVPKAGGRGGGNRYAAFLLLLHPVHRRCAVVHFPHPVEASCIKQDALRRRRFAGVDVRADTDIPCSIERVLSGHTLIHHHLKWANALLASAILCVSSFFLMAFPSPFEAAINSAASFRDIDRSFRSLA